MAKDKASLDTLSELHGKVAKIMVKTIDRFDTAMDMVGEDDTDVPVLISPAFLGACTKFLSDNKISVDLADSSDMQELDAKLKQNAEKRKRRSVDNVTFLDVG